MTFLFSVLLIWMSDKLNIRINERNHLERICKKKNKNINTRN